MRMGLGVGYKGLLSASRRAARSRSTRNGGDGLAAQVAHALLLVELAVALQAERDTPRVDARRDADARRARWAVFVELVLADGSVRVRQVLPSIVRVHAEVAVFAASDGAADRTYFCFHAESQPKTKAPEPKPLPR